MNQLFTIEWWDDIHGEPEPGQHRGPYLGKKLMRAEVRVEIDLPALARHLGRIACRNKSGKSVDGFITVRKVTAPSIVRRELK